MRDVVLDIGVRDVELPGRGDVTVALLGHGTGDDRDRRIDRDGDGSLEVSIVARLVGLRDGHRANDGTDDPTVDLIIRSKLPAVQPILLADQGPKIGCAKIQRLDRAVPLTHGQEVVRELGLVTAMKCAGTDVENAGAQPGPVVIRQTHVLGKAVQCLVVEAAH